MISEHSHCINIPLESKKPTVKTIVCYEAYDITKTRRFSSWICKYSSVKLEKKKKGRHALYYEANDIVRTGRFSWHKMLDWVDDIIKIFESYVDDVKDKVILLENAFGSGEYLALPYFTRANRQYINKVSRRLSPLKKVKQGVFMTLTTDPKLFCSLYDAHKSMMKNFHKLISFLNEKHKHELQYVMVPEFTKSNIIHLHVVFLGIDYLIDQQELSEKWMKYGQGKIVDVRYFGQNHNRQGALHYIMKYIEKGWQKNNGMNSAHLSLLWSMNARGYSTSKNLLSVIECYRIPQEWKLMMIVPLDLFRTVLDDSYLFSKFYDQDLAPKLYGIA